MVKSKRKSQWWAVSLYVFRFKFVEEDSRSLPRWSWQRGCVFHLWLPEMLLSSHALPPRFWCTAALNSLKRAALIFRACFWSPSPLPLTLSTSLSLLQKTKLMYSNFVQSHTVNTGLQLGVFQTCKTCFYSILLYLPSPAVLKLLWQLVSGHVGIKLLLWWIPVISFLFSLHELILIRIWIILFQGSVESLHLNTIYCP